MGYPTWHVNHLLIIILLFSGICCITQKNDLKAGDSYIEKMERVNPSLCSCMCDFIC